jgi:holin-like protein
MKYIRQLAVIFSVTCVAEILKYFIPLPIPASIYGLVLMFCLLATGIIKLPQVKETANFLIEIMPLMFIPATVGLMDSWATLRPILLPVIVIMTVTMVLVMGVTGCTAQAILRRKEKKQ